MIISEIGQKEKKVILICKYKLAPTHELITEAYAGAKNRKEKGGQFYVIAKDKTI